MLREDGEVWLGLQVQHQFGDPSRDLAAVLTQALALADEGAEPGIVGLTDPPGPGPRLQDLVANDRLDVTVHDGFGFWVADSPTRAGATAQTWASRSSVRQRWLPRLSRARAWISSTITVSTVRRVARLRAAVTRR